MADFTVRDGRQFGFDVSIDGQLVRGMEFRPGLPLPSAAHLTRAGASAPTRYRDGVDPRDPDRDVVPGVRNRPGGVRVRLGDHPYAKELASLGLPKRALVSSSVDNVEMSFGDAQSSLRRLS